MKIPSVIASAVTGASAVIGAGALAGTGVVAPVATDADIQKDANAVASIVTDATPGHLALDTVAVSEVADGFVAQVDAADVTIPREASEPVVVDIDGDGAVEISLTTEAVDEAEGSVAQDGTVVYENESTHQSVQAVEEGVRIHTVIENADAPEEFAHEVELPEGARLATEDEVNELLAVPADFQESGAVYVLRADNSTLGVFDEPWAVDANGNAVPTHYEIRDNAVVQVVDHSDVTAYPVVADPLFGIFRSFIQSARWEANDAGQIPARGDRRLLVTPTAYAKASGFRYSYGVAGWNELINKYGRSLSINYNTNAMRDQWICHQLGAAAMSDSKLTWNLEEWRPNVGLVRTVASSCNPTDAGIGSSR